MGVQEIADLLGVSRQRADELSRRRGFPRPRGVLRLSRRRIWDEAAVRVWAKGEGRVLE